MSDHKEIIDNKIKIENSKDDINAKDIKDNLLDIFSFSGEELGNIWTCVKSKEKKCGDFNLQYPNVDKNENNNLVYIKKGELQETFYFYKSPLNLKIEKNEYKIHTCEQCRNILQKFDLRIYSITVDNVKINNKRLNYKNIKSIIINKIEPDILEEAFNKYILRDIPKFPFQESIVKVEKKFLSLYFDDICNSFDKKEDSINLILDNNRIEFINKINQFLYSEKVFYLSFGTDGIGKTITLLYYSSSVLNDYNNIYLNLKLFFKYKKNKNKLKEIFYDEIKRIFLIDKAEKDNASYSYTKYNKLIKKMDETNPDMDGIQYFWELLFLFIKNYNDLIVDNIFIILDQYKIDQIDDNYENLNKLCNMIQSSGFETTAKLMILISINNYDTKNIFLENLSYVPFYPTSVNNLIPSPKYRSNIFEDFDININNTLNENKTNNYELDDIENYLNEKQKEFQTNFNKILYDSLIQPFEVISKLDLNSIYSNITKKEYINEIVNCKNLLSDNINENYLNCLEVFGYSIKYYYLLLNQIKSEKRENDESDDEFAKKVVNKFYKRMVNKIHLKLDTFYSTLYGKNYDTYLEKKINNLKSLNDSIYEEKIYNLNDMNKLLKIFPIKYLNIYIVGIDNNSIPLDKLDLSKYGFFFDYANAFIKETIYKYYLKESSFYYKSFQLEDNEFSTIFEDLVISKLSRMNDNNKIIKRNVFSLVGTKAKSYILSLRKKENLEFYDFYDLKVLNFKIDGVDNIKVTKNDIDIINNDIYLKQLSRGGRSFDAGFLKARHNKMYKINEPTHDLILFQSTKHKIGELKDKIDYFTDIELTKEFLQKTYEGLQIGKTYLIFVLPYGLRNIETINKLNYEKLYYIFYNPKRDIFLDKDSNVIQDFCVPEAEVQFKNKDFNLLLALTNINLSKNIINKSVSTFLGKKRLFEDKFINVYNKISQEKAFNCISVIIPIELKSKIIEKLKEDGIFSDEKSINFIPSINCNPKEIPSIFFYQKNLFIFSYGGLIYLYYYNYYLISNDFSVTKIDNPNIVINSTCKKPTKNLVSFFDMTKFPLFCFGFTVIKNHIFE